MRRESKAVAREWCGRWREWRVRGVTCYRV